MKFVKMIIIVVVLLCPLALLVSAEETTVEETTITTTVEETTAEETQVETTVEETQLETTVEETTEAPTVPVLGFEIREFTDDGLGIGYIANRLAEIEIMVFIGLVVFLLIVICAIFYKFFAIVISR